MSTSTLTSKGQITIPHEIRTLLGLHTGDKIEFIVQPDKTVSIMPLTADISELKGLLPKPKKTVSIEDMNKAIAKRGANL